MATRTATPISSACSSSRAASGWRSTPAPPATASRSTTRGIARRRATAPCCWIRGRSRRRQRGTVACVALGDGSVRGAGPRYAWPELADWPAVVQRATGVRLDRRRERGVCRCSNASLAGAHGRVPDRRVRGHGARTANDRLAVARARSISRARREAAPGALAGVVATTWRATFGGFRRQRPAADLGARSCARGSLARAGSRGARCWPPCPATQPRTVTISSSAGEWPTRRCLLPSLPRPEGRRWFAGGMADEPDRLVASGRPDRHDRPLGGRRERDPRPPLGAGGCRIWTGWSARQGAC